MIKYIQNGKYRTLQLRITKKVDGNIVEGDGFPIVISIADAFPGFDPLTEAQVSQLSDVQYNQRVNAFKEYVLQQYHFLGQGDFKNPASGTDGAICTPGLEVGESIIPITNDTNITIYFDSSGSMNTTLPPLQEMRNTLMKDAFLPFYNNNEDVYNQRVSVISQSNERTFAMLNKNNNAWDGKNLVMVFQDEAQPVYTANTTFVPRTAAYDTDIALLRGRISQLEPNTYRGVVFQVVRTANNGITFREFIQAVENGIAPYDGLNGLSDRFEFGYSYEVQAGAGAQYYMDLVVAKMRQLGYII